MNDELDFKILEALAKYGVGEWADITTVFDDQFLIPDVERGDLIGKNGSLEVKLARIIEFLTFMQERDYLSFIDYSYLSEIGDREKGEPVTIKKTISIDAMLTPKGNLYYKEICLIQSKIDDQRTEANYLIEKRPNDNQNPNKPTLRQIALLYSLEGKSIIRGDNANSIAATYNHNSGDRLYNLFSFYSNRRHRIAIVEGHSCETGYKQKVELFSTVIEMLNHNERVKSKATDELNLLKATLEN